MNKIIKNAILNDNVQCVKNGKGVIISTNHSADFPLLVKFTSGATKFYTLDGRSELYEGIPVLYYIGDYEMNPRLVKFISENNYYITSKGKND